MLWAATYVVHRGGANHTEPFKLARFITIRSRRPTFVVGDRHMAG